MGTTDRDEDKVASGECDAEVDALAVAANDVCDAARDLIDATRSNGDPGPGVAHARVPIGAYRALRNATDRHRMASEALIQAVRGPREVS